AAFGTDNSVLIDAGDDALGLQIFNIDTKCVETWNGVEWIKSCICPPSVTDAQGITYSVGYFGLEGCWMTQNLRTTDFTYTPDGTPIALSENTGESDTDPYYSYPTEGNVTPTTAKFDAHPEYGLLYNWVAASGRTGVSTNEAKTEHTTYQGICPKGWHLPSDYEWIQLTNELKNNNTNSKYGTGTNAYCNMKSTTAVAGTDISDPNGCSNTRDNNGFDALFVGVVNINANKYGLHTHFWSSSSYNENDALARAVETGTGSSYESKVGLRSVRCKKD
ncbi:MAG: fibrobacter succinogenes major paralogous domain-containing protein, partial [Dysgonamonadaceae bacterium]|nr:fibrobacter succinogenes major paralogous domain-containing protein [Dysgonamonadaceae bacterium]